MSNLCSKRALEVVLADLGPEYDFSGTNLSDFNEQIAPRRLGYCKTMVYSVPAWEGVISWQTKVL